MGKRRKEKKPSTRGDSNPPSLCYESCATTADQSMTILKALAWPIFDPSRYFQARDVKECEVDFNPEFTARVIPKLDWPEVARAAQSLGQLGDTPTEVPVVSSWPGSPLFGS